MPERILHILRAAWQLTSPDRVRRLPRWALLCAGVLAAAALLQLCGWEEWLGDRQIIMLTGDPFQMSALDVQVSLLSPGATWALSSLLTLYLGAVLLRQPALSKRSHICLLAAAALALPGLMCVLWGGVLYVGLPLTCVLLLWLALVPLAFIRRYCPL